MANGAEARARWNPLRGLYAWVMHNAEGKYAWATMAAIAFAESSFFPMPPDIVMVPMALKDRRRAFLMAACCTLFSVMGGLLGYALGSWLYDSVGAWLIRAYGMGSDIELFQRIFNGYSWLILLQGLTPIPYKLVTIAAGFAAMNLGYFMLLSAITRSIRFFGVALLIYRYGEPVRLVIEKYLEIVLVAFLILITVGYFVFHYVFRHLG
ncbi:MAG: DedA family protein [Alphaproteobacteria bacterium]|nr:DedA family protein [Alphaproteobacteria bacterium]